MPNRRTLAASLVAALAIGTVASGGSTAAGDSDDDRDKNTLLAEAQFQLHLLNADFVPSDITCTRPPARDDAGELLCYALISDRITVAAVASMQSPGVYGFLPVNKVDPAELITESPPPDPTLPQDTTSTTTGPSESPISTDQAILESMDLAVAGTDDLSTMMLEDSPITSVDLIAYHAPTSTLQVTVSTDATDAATRDSVAFYVTDVMAYLWEDTEPTRKPDATIHPRLEVTVDDVIYGSAFDVMVDVADYAITEDEWIDIATGNIAFRAASRIRRHSVRLYDAASPAARFDHLLRAHGLTAVTA